MMYDVAVIGCGVVGASIAHELSKYRLSVLVLEAENDAAMHTTRANSAIVHAGYDPLPGTLMARLNVRGASLMEALTKRLSVDYRRCGSLVVAFDGEQTEELRRLFDRGLQNGVPGLTLLSGEQARELEPTLSSGVTSALLAPSAGIVNPWELCIALAETAAANGAEFRFSHPVASIRRMDEGFLIAAGGGEFPARRVVNAAGVDADAVERMAGLPSFKSHPSRGQYYLLDKSQGNLVSRVIFQCPTREGKGVLVAPTVHGNLIVGPNAEPVKSGDDATTREGLEFVRKTALLSVPDIRFGESIRNFSGIRAVTDREDFILEPSPTVPGFINAAGIKSPGLSCAPAIGEYVAGLLSDSGLNLIFKQDFDDRRERLRFEHLSPEEKAALVKRNPAYGRVICRCETITEGEILDALRSPLPPRTLDGIKRRCGAGMGRCQGGFCGPRVHELISRELKLPMEAVLQDRDGSYILTGETKGEGCK